VALPLGLVRGALPTAFDALGADPDHGALAARAIMTTDPFPKESAAQFGIGLILARAVASASLLFTGVTRLPLTAAWDHVAPRWLMKLDPKRRTPVHSILFVASLVMAFIALSLLGVGDQESSQLLVASSVVHYAIAYAALFALPLFGALSGRLPGWLKIAAGAGLLSSLIALGISVYPVVEVVSRRAYAVKIASVVVLTNLLGLALYRWAGRRRDQAAASR